MTDIEICQYEMLYPIPTLEHDPGRVGTGSSEKIMLKTKKGWGVSRARRPFERRAELAEDQDHDHRNRLPGRPTPALAQPARRASSRSPGREIQPLEHDPEKWIPVFRTDHA